MAVTPSKQWIHFFRSDLCPPTSNILEEENESDISLSVPKLRVLQHQQELQGERGMGGKEERTFWEEKNVRNEKKKKVWFLKIVE